MERFVKTSGTAPHAQLENVISIREIATDKFIDRAYQKAKENAAEKTTERGEQATMERFFQQMQKYYPRMTQANIAHIESIKDGTYDFNAASVLDDEWDPPSEKNKVAALIMCIFLGYLGVHRFYVGKMGTGVLWLCSVGACGIGWIYDIFCIATGRFTDSNGRLLE